MEVAVARVEEVGQLKVVALRHLLDAGEQRGELRAWDDGILEHHVGSQPTQSAEGVLSCPPHPRAIAFGRRQAHLPGSGRLYGRKRHRHLLLGLLLGSLALHDQRGSRVRGQACRVHGCLDDPNRRRIDDLESDGKHTRFQDLGDGAARIRHAAEQRQERPDRLRARHQANGDGARDPERALGADEQAGQIESSALAPVQLERRAVRKHDLQGEHVVARYAVLQAMRPARVGRHVAADRARRGRSRIRQIAKTVRGGGRGYVVRHDSRLHDGQALRGIDAEDSIESCGDDEDGGASDRSTGQAGAGPAGNKRNACLVQQSHRGTQLVARRRQRHGERHSTDRGERVGLVCEEAVRLLDEARGTEPPPQIP